MPKSCSDCQFDTLRVSRHCVITGNSTKLCNEKKRQDCPLNEITGEAILFLKKMPKSCMDCFLRFEKTGCCKLTSENTEEYINKRRDDCPLIYK